MSALIAIGVVVGIVLLKESDAEDLATARQALGYLCLFAAACIVLLSWKGVL